MQRAYSILAAAIAGTLASTVAIAQAEQAAPNKAPADAFIEQLDTDGDGTVSLEEAVAPQKARFDETDLNGDGFVDAEEAGTAFNEQVPEEMLKAMEERGMPDPGETFVKNLDENGDGQIDRGEFEAPTVASFERMDTNDDGVATNEEATAFFEDMQQRMQEQMQKMQQQKGAVPQQ
jgi:Ca2+-binding EF-hand superfamily protein